MSELAPSYDPRPSILVSFAYRREWSKISDTRGFRVDDDRADEPPWREVVLDSGAFTAWQTGKPVDIVEFAEWVDAQRATNPLVTEVFTLDVIGGDWRESLANTEYLWKRGIQAIPVFHVGEPLDVLKALAKDYPKISLGGAVGYRKRDEWAALCFKAVWPKKMHGLGYGETSLWKLPFHTIDNSSWAFGPSKFGDFHSLKTKQIRGKRVSIGTHNVRCEIDFYVREEQRLRRFWKGRLPSDWGEDVPSIRLATTADKWQAKALLTLPGKVREELLGKRERRNK